MTSDALRQSVRDCRNAFDFLVSDLGYRRDAVDFGAGGFALLYRADTVGVRISWYPRDPLAVMIVRLSNDDSAVSGYRSFDLEDIEVISGYTWPGGRPSGYAMPTDEDYLRVADSLRTHAADLIRGDLARVPQLEERIRARR